MLKPINRMRPAGLKTPKLLLPFMLPFEGRLGKEREQIRTQVWELLGKLPPRPKTPKVQTLSREDRGDYIVEKFQFDNGAGADRSGLRPLAQGVFWQSRPPSFIATGMAANMTLAKRNCSSPGTQRRARTGVCETGLRGDRQSMPIALANAMAAVRAGCGEGPRRRIVRQQIQFMGRAHVMGHDLAGRFDGAGLPRLAAGSGCRAHGRDGDEHGRDARPGG